MPSGLDELDHRGLTEYRRARIREIWGLDRLDHRTHRVSTGSTTGMGSTAGGLA